MQLFSFMAHAAILNSEIEIIPTTPSTADKIQIQVTVVLPNPCYKVSFSALATTDHTFQSSVDITPPAEGTVCIEVLGRFTHTYSLGFLEQGNYRFELAACERDPIGGICVLTPVSQLSFTVFVADNVIPAGSDFFVVDSQVTQFNFTGDFAIPSEFFDQGSRPWTGTVRLSGPSFSLRAGSAPSMSPLPLFTIIERKQAVGFAPKRLSSNSTPIQLATMLLQSLTPISVRVGNQHQRWDVFAELSAARPSTGTLTITKRHTQGGTFSLELTVFPVFYFVRQSDGLKKGFDLGERTRSSGNVKKLTLKIKRAPWLTTCAIGEASSHSLGIRFCPGITPTGQQRIRAQSAAFTLGLRFVPSFVYSSIERTNPEQALDLTGPVNTTIELFSLSGQRLHTQSLDSHVNALDSVSTKELPNGVYLYVATVRDSRGRILKSEMRKFVALK
jgi:hypothetical protein